MNLYIGPTAHLRMSHEYLSQHSPGVGPTYKCRATLARASKLLIFGTRDGRANVVQKSHVAAIGSYREIAIAIESEAGDSLT